MAKRVAYVLLLVIAGCGGGPKKTLKIGTILDLTGVLASIGDEELKAANLAADEINKAGGVLESQIEIVNKDDGTDKEKGKVAAQALIELKVPVVIGAIASGVTLAVHPELKAAQIVQISGSSTSPSITTETDDGYLFRTCPSDAFQGKLIAKRAKDKQFTAVAIIHLPDAYGVGLANTFENEFKALGGTVTSKIQYVEEQTSYKPTLDQVYGTTTKPRAILLVAYPKDGAQIVNDYLSAYTGEQTYWFFTDAVQDKDGFVTPVGGSRFTFQHEGTGPGAPKGARYDAYAAAFKAKFDKDPQPGTFSTNVYDAVYLAALAIEAAGKAEGPAVKEHIAAVSAGGTAYGAADVKTLLADIKAKKDVNYEGASGNVDFDANGDVIAPYDVWKVENGAIKILEQVSP